MGGEVFDVVFGLELSRGLEGGKEDGNARSWPARGKLCYTLFVCQGAVREAGVGGILGGGI